MQSSVTVEVSDAMNVLVLPSSAGRDAPAAGAALWEVLRDYLPDYVIVTDPDATCVREIEVAHEVRRRCNASAIRRVYMMLFADSADEQLFLGAIERERRAFETLIDEKAHIVIPPLVSRASDNAAFAAVSGSSAAWSGDAAPARHKVIVDMREFRSALPSMLNLADYELQVETLTVGDYVLSPGICVERKALADLIESLKSGRLFTQAESMCRHYAVAVLLIEFDPARPCSIHERSVLPDELKRHSTAARLVVLTRHFPKLRILWSQSARATVALFTALKFKRPEPERATAADIGISGEQTSAAGVTQNTAARDLLRRLPGVTARNMPSLILAAKSLAGLAKMSRQDLGKLIGGKNAGKLHAFLNAAN